MKPPFAVGEGIVAGQVRVTDARHRVVCSIPNGPEAPKIAAVIVKRFNREWRLRRILRAFLREQPYEYTREDWLHEKSSQRVGGSA